MLWLVQNTTSFQTMLVALVSNLWLRPKKAWLRFRYPRWMYDGPLYVGYQLKQAGFLKGWYAQNGVIKKSTAWFVCVSEDLTGQFGFCGYFKEYDRELSDNERLIFSPKERPPNFNPTSSHYHRTDTGQMKD